MNEKFNYDCLNDETPRLFTMDLSSLKFTDKEQIINFQQEVGGY